MYIKILQKQILNYLKKTFIGVIKIGLIVEANPAIYPRGLAKNRKVAGPAAEF